MKKSKLILIAFLIMTVAICAAVLVACDGYNPKTDLPNIKHNAVLTFERSSLEFAKDMSVDTVDVIVKSGCAVSDDEGNEVRVTADHLQKGIVSYEDFDVSSVGSEKRIKVSYKDAYNFIEYSVAEYTVNFYLDEGCTDLWTTTPAKASLSDDLKLSVGINVNNYNYSVDAQAKQTDINKANKFSGWYDAASNSITGTHSLASLNSGDHRVFNLHAHFLSDAEFAQMSLSYDGSGRRVFGGYSGTSETVIIPEGVTFVDLHEVFARGINFKTLSIPSTAIMDVALQSALNTDSLKNIVVDKNNAQYASFEGGLYSKDLTTLYLMPAQADVLKFPEQLETFATFSCAYLQADSLTLPSGTKTLDSYCFAYSNLVDVVGYQNVPNQMAGIFWGSRFPLILENNAYYAVDGNGHYSLSSVINKKDITTFTVKEGTTNISGLAFSGCENLTSIDLGDKLESIGDEAFAGCKSLKTITLPATVKSFGYGVFSSITTGTGNLACDNLTTVIGMENITFSTDKEDMYALPSQTFSKCKKLTSVTLPSKLTSIGSSAFDGCESLASITLPDSVEKIGNYAFRYCAFTSLDMPSKLNSLGTGVFSHTKLKTADFSVCKDLKKFSDRLFQQSDIESFVFPDGISAASNYMFYQAKKLTEVTLNNVETLGQHCFSYCEKLTTFNWGTKLKTIDRSFSNCTALTEINLPDSVESVAYAAFQRCDNLKKITLGKNVKTFGTYTFLNDGITFGDGNGSALWQTYNVEVIEIDPENPTLKMFDGVMYASSICGKDYGENGVILISLGGNTATQFIARDSAKVIAPYAFANNKYLTSITLNDGLENIGKAAFYMAEALTSFNIPSTVINIGAGITLSAVNAMEIELSKDNKTFKQVNGAIYSNTSLILASATSQNVVIQPNTTTVTAGSFMNNNVIASVVIPDSITTLGSKTFQGCSNLEAIEIGSGLKTLDPTAFSFLPSLTSIKVSEDNPYFKSGNDNTVLYSKNGETLLLVAAKNGWTNLDNLENGVKAIGAYAFSHHATLTEAKLPNGVKSVGDYAFYECRSLQAFFGCDGLESIGAYAFSFATTINPDDSYEQRRCDVLKTVVLWRGIEKVGDYAFNGQYGIEKLYLRMTEAEALAFFTANKASKNLTHLQFGCSLPNQAKQYYNNGGRGIDRYLYSATQTELEISGYAGWFRFDTNGEPVIWEGKSN